MHPKLSGGATSAVIVAAGSGTRMAGEAKQFRNLGGIPMLQWSVATMLASPEVEAVTVVLPSRFDPAATGMSDDALSAVTLAEGGASRSDSVAAGLATVQSEFVLIHDAARPFLTSAVVKRLVGALVNGERAVIAGVAIADTVKRVEGGRVRETVDRSELFAAQTPQGFETELLRSLHESRRQEGDEPAVPTDDAQLAERAGIEVAVVEGEALNFKVTFEEDFLIASALVESGLVRRAGIPAAEVE